MSDDLTKPKKNLLWLWILLGIIIILIVVGSSWAVKAGKWNWVKKRLGIKTVETNSSQSVSVSKVILDKTPDSDWQTFTNTKYRFSFKFPNDWKNQAFVGKTQDDGTGYPDYILTSGNNDPNLIKKYGILLFEKFYSGEDGATGFENWADANATSCSADAPCAHADCKNVKQKVSIKTQEGLSGYRYTIVRRTVSNSDGLEKDDKGGLCPQGVEEKEFGPVYELNVFDLTSGQLKLIRISPEILDGNVLKVSDDIWEKIVNSVKFY